MLLSARSQKFGPVRIIFIEMGVRYQIYVASIIYCHAHFYKNRGDPACDKMRRLGRGLESNNQNATKMPNYRCTV